VTEDGLHFVAATPVWWQTQAPLAYLLEADEVAEPAVRALREVAAVDGPLPEVLILVPGPESASAEAVQDWLLEHLWLPALVLEGGGGAPALAARARAGDIRTVVAR
jgi:hypothetical protein